MGHRGGLNQVRSNKAGPINSLGLRPRPQEVKRQRCKPNKFASVVLNHDYLVWELVLMARKRYSVVDILTADFMAHDFDSTAVYHLLSDYQN